MANAKDIHRRIRAVDNTRQITRAMELVARTKLRRAQEQAVATRAYAEALVQLLRRVAGRGGDPDMSPFFEIRPVTNRLVIAITADRGLCGSYNSNVLRVARNEIAGDDPAHLELIPVGRKGRDHFRNRGYEIYEEFVNIGEEADLGLARTLARVAGYEFTSGRVDEVVLVFTEFQSVFRQRVRSLTLLPIDPEAEVDEGEREWSEGARRREGLYLYEPNPEVIFEELLPRFVTNSIFRALAESKASEQASRVTAMNNATENAGELIEELTREYNRVRQAQITREITEIAGGAEALAAARGER
ncbi:MAG: ATP synthase F1 subunit gamma [Bacillota bacterium]